MPLVWWRLGNEWLAAEQDLAHGLPSILVYLYILTFRPIERTPLFRYERLASTLLMLGPLFIYLIAEAVNIHALSYLALLGALAVSFSLFFGWRAALRYWHLHCLFLITLPFWDALLEPLVRLASFVSAAILTPLDFTMLIEGNSITVPSGRIIIAEGCSGIRYFMVAILLGYLLANLNGYRSWKLMLTVGSAALLGLIANWVRICLLILIGYYTEMESSLMHDHEVFGWVIFAAFCIPAFYFAPHRSVATAEPSKGISKASSWPSTVKKLAIAVAVGLMLNMFIHHIRTPDQDQQHTTHFSYNAWRHAHYQPIGVATPGIDYSAWSIPQDDIYLLYATHQRQQPEDKLVPFFLRSRVGEVWFAEKQFTQPLASNHPLSQSFNKGLTLRFEVFKSLRRDERVLSVEIFRIGNKITSSYNEAKIQQIGAILSKQNIFEYFLLQKVCEENNCQSTQADLIKALALLGDDPQQKNPEIL